MPEKYFFAGKERSHDASAHTACFFKKHFETDPSTSFLLFWSWLGCGILLILCRIAICLAVQIGFSFLDLLSYLETAWYTVRLLFAIGTGTVCLLSAFVLSAWIAMVIRVAAAVLPLGNALVFAAGSRRTGWDLVDDGCVAVCHTVCFVCDWIFLASPSDDCCTGVAGAFPKC